MHEQWGIIADDLTGACDTGAIFAQKGLATVVVLDRRRRLDAGAEVVVLTSKSRNDPVRSARRKVEEACRYLRARRIGVLYKKIDSTLKGNVLEETSTVMTASEFSRALLCPAYPAQGRKVRRGVLFVRGRRTADLLAVFSEQKDCRLVSVHLPVTLAKVAAAISSETQFILPDAEAQGDLDCLVKAAMQSKRRVLLAGSGGLTTALANALGEWAVPRLGEKSWRINSSREVVRPTLIFTGSNNPVTARQIDTLLQARLVDVHSLQRRQAMQDSLRQHQLAVVRVPVHQSRDDTIFKTLASFDFLFTESRLANLVVIGGDTAALILRWLETQAIEIHGEIAPGIPWGRMIGGKADGLALCTKAGGFGKPGSLVQIVTFLARTPR